MEIVLKEQQGKTVFLTLTRPEKRNAFRPLTVDEMQKALEDARFDERIGVIILTGEGEKAFCSGGDQNIRGNAVYADGERAGMIRLVTACLLPCGKGTRPSA